MEILALKSQFIAYLLTERRISANTVSAYRNDLDQFFAYLTQEEKTLHTITRDTIRDFLHYLHKQGISARSISRKISCLKTFFAYADKKFGIENCAHEIPLPLVEKKLPTVIPEHELEQLFAVVDTDITPLGSRNKIILYLLYVSGMRISELTQLKKDALHFDTGFVCVSGKGGKSRMIPLPLSMLQALRDYLLHIHPHLLAQNKQSDYLFPIAYAGKIKPISRQSVWMLLKELWSRTGNTRNISPHTLRHSLATHLLKRGAHLRSLQLLLGHESLNTVQVYTHVEPGYLRTIYNKKHPRS